MRIFHFFQIVVFSLIIAGCNDNKKQNGPHENDEIQFAKHVQIEKSDSTILLHILDPEKNTIEKKYALTRKLETTIPKGYSRIMIPIKSITALSSTQIGMLSVLNQEEKINGISDKNYVWNSKVLKGVKAGKIVEVGNEGMITLEKLIKIKPSIVMYSGFGKEFPHQKQLEQIGIQCVVNYDWKEMNPLGKAEWIKVLGALTDQLEESENYFNQLVEEYNSLKNLAQKSNVSPTVFSGNITGDIWYTPAGESFTAQLFKDANLDYVYKKTKGTGSLALSFEKILSENTKTAYWLNPEHTTIHEILEMNPKMNFFDAVKNKNVFCYSKNMNYYWEMSAIQPHHVLSDLIQLLHPDVKLQKKLYFYKNICQ
jgi:iron complex transport system substrate-binding protein